MFGQPQKPLFGASTNIFGQAPQTTASIFGATPAPQNTFGQPSFFGSNQPQIQQQPSSFNFGQPTFQANAPNILGGSTSSNVFGSSFGQPQAAATNFASSSFGSVTVNGTTIKFKAPTTQDTMYKGGVSQNISGAIQCISAMKEYEDKSLEELRLEDYVANRKFGTPSAPTQFGFIASQTATPSLFGQPSASNLFAPAATPSATNLFGQPTTQSTFGTLQASSNLFGQQPTLQSQQSIFGQQQAGLFGSSLTTTTAGTSGLFGTANKFLLGPSASTSATPGFAFNYNAPTTTTGSTNLFGFGAATPATATVTPFQQAPSSSQFGFGGIAPTGPTPLFGGAPKGFSFGSVTTTNPGGFSFTTPLNSGAEAKPFFGFGSVASTGPVAGGGMTSFGSGATNTFGTGFTFGTPQPAVTTAPAGFSFFGSAAATASSSSGTTSSIFGGQPNIFGAPAATTSSTFGTGYNFNFGSVPTAPTTTTQSFMFGNVATTSLTSIAPNFGFNFGTTASTAPPSGFTFGAPSQPGTGGFGMPLASTTSAFSNLFGNAPSNIPSTMPSFPSGNFGQPGTVNLFYQQQQQPLQQQQQPPSFGQSFGAPGVFGTSGFNIQPAVSQVSVGYALNGNTFDSPQNIILRKQILDMVNLMPYGDVPIIQSITTDIKLDQVDSRKDLGNSINSINSELLRRKQLESLYSSSSRGSNTLFAMHSMPSWSSPLHTRTKLKSSLFISEDNKSRDELDGSFLDLPGTPRLSLDGMFLPRKTNDDSVDSNIELNQRSRHYSVGGGGANKSFNEQAFSDKREGDEKSRLLALKLMARSNDRLYEESLRLSSRKPNLKALQIDKSKVLNRTIASRKEENIMFANKSNLSKTPKSPNMFNADNTVNPRPRLPYEESSVFEMGNNLSTHFMMQNNEDVEDVSYINFGKGSESRNRKYLHPIRHITTFNGGGAQDNLNGFLSEEEDDGDFLHESRDKRDNSLNASNVSGLKSYQQIYPSLTPETYNLDQDMIDSSQNNNKNIDKSDHYFKRPLFKCTKDGYYTEPGELECYKTFVDHINSMDGDEPAIRSFLMKKEFYVQDLLIGRKGYGSIKFIGLINVMGLDIDKYVFIDVKDVAVYIDDTDKPPMGEGMNRKAIITLYNTWPNDKQNQSPIKDSNRVKEMKYDKKLEIACRKMGANFIDYEIDTGTWIFEVPHF